MTLLVLGFSANPAFQILPISGDTCGTILAFISTFPLLHLMLRFKSLSVVRCEDLTILLLYWEILKK